MWLILSLGSLYQFFYLLIHPTLSNLPDTYSFITPSWGLDLVGKIHPTSSNGHKFILTATKYFTKWVEEILMTFTTWKQIAKFILNYIICRYGLPLCIVTDNDRPFKNQEVSELCDQFHIHQRFTTVYYLQSNGQAEATNKNILNFLKKVVNDTRWDWHLQLNPALWAYQTGVRIATGNTPYSFV